jgi:site-specific DNA-cytosine methylase
LAFEDPRSKLFFEYVRILKECRGINPNIKFLLENVKMKKQHLSVITDILGVEPVFINSALLSAQNRQRYYWCNWEITPPEDRGLNLESVVENGFVDRQKSYAIDANYWKGGSVKNYLKKHRRQIVFCGQIVGRKINPETGKRDDYNPGIKPIQRLEIRNDGKTGCLTGVQKDNVVTDGVAYRNLTPIECERLQTLPDNYTECVSKTQRYKCLGNAWTVDVITHCLLQS